MQLLAFGLNPLELFLALDFFSRAYVTGLLLAVALSISIFIRLVAGMRRPSASARTSVSYLAEMTRNLDSLFCLSAILAAACFASTILAVCRVYMVDRATDANPVDAITTPASRRPE